MTIFDLLFARPGRARRSLVVFTAMGALSNVGALIIINVAAANPAGADIYMFLWFVAAAVANLVSGRQSAYYANILIEDELHGIKSRLVGKIERAELARIERVGTSAIYDRITENVATISNIASLLGDMLESLCFLIVGALYLAWLSPETFFILVGLQLVAIRLLRLRRARLTSALQAHAQARVRFLDSLTDIMRGAKEIRFSSARRDDAVATFEQTSADARDARVSATNHLFDEVLFLNTNLLALLGALVFVLPQYMHISAMALAGLVASILFVWGGAQAFLSGYGALIQANQALRNVATLEAELEAAASKREAALVEDEQDPWQGKSGRIEAMQVEYEYTSADSDETFQIGPLDLVIEPGEILFIVGGNGAGKSTLVKVLTGLYAPTSGTLKVAGVRVQPTNVAAYRETISAIFSDFHLFRKLYGMLDIEPGAVRTRLEEMQMQHKTSFAGGQFTRRDLSTGQRKRLAMVIALLEDRPIYVLDEWAADQDPEFRQYFYETLLPALKQRGKTVIAVSHDDRYFRCADRVVFMEYGKIREIHYMTRPAGDSVA